MNSQSGEADGENKAEGSADAPPSIQGEKAEISTQPTTTEGQHARRSAYWEKRQYWVQATIAVVGTVSVIIYGCQLREMQKSTDAATKAAVAAEDGIRKTEATAHLDQRAWIGIVGIEGFPAVGSRFKVDVTLKNTGKTFARKVTIRAGILPAPNWQIPDFEKLLNGIEPNGRGLVPPDGTLHSINQFGTDYTEKEIADLELGVTNLYVFGKSTYEDIFFCEHWTTFCYKLGGDRESGWKHNAYQSYNEADVNCGPTP